MPNPQNLTPFLLNKRDPEKRKEIARMGALATQRVKKVKRTLKEQLEMAVDIMTEKTLKNEKLDPEQKKLLENSNIVIYEILNTVMNKKVKDETRLKASDMILDRIHGKPKQEVETKITNDEPFKIVVVKEK